MTNHPLFPLRASRLRLRKRGQIMFSGHYPEYNAALLDRVNLESDEDFFVQIKKGQIEVLSNFPEDGSACLVVKRRGCVYIYRYTKQGAVPMNDRTETTTDEALFITPEMRPWLDKSSITLFSGEKMIVVGHMLHIYDSEETLIEERPLMGREAQLIATMIFLQHQREAATSEMGNPTQEDIFESAVKLVGEATKIKMELLINNGNVHVGPTNIRGEEDESTLTLTEKARRSTFLRMPDNQLFRTNSYDSTLGFLHTTNDATGKLHSFHIETELKDAKFFRLQPF